MKRLTTTYSRLTAATLLALFLSFFVGRGMCYHTHLINQVLVSHSHPYSDASHNHTADQINSIDCTAASSLTDEIMVDSRVQFIPSFVTLLSSAVTQKSGTGFDSVSDGRAPPCMLTI